jgi:hypothetical protein
MEILEWIGDLALAHHLKRSALLYMAVNAAHSCNRVAHRRDPAA